MAGGEQRCAKTDGARLTMNPLLDRLQAYPFERLSRLLDRVAPPEGTAPIRLSIGEPRHPAPPFVRDALIGALDGLSRYPSTRGEESYRVAIRNWIARRYDLPSASLDPARHILPVNGTREALFSIAQAVVDGGSGAGGATVLMPNPFYQIYEGAAFMAGAEPLFVNATPETGFQPNFETLPGELLDRAQLLYLCSPGNPTGACYSLDQLKRLIELARRHDLILASDECYSEIWYDAPPPGILQAAAEMGVDDFKNCVAFNSLSKRSNIPGARAGFAAGDPEILARYFQLRTYTGCATPPFIQAAAQAAWEDEVHVAENRALYAAKLDRAIDILSSITEVSRPEAGFYLWLKVPGGGEAFTHRLYRDYNVTLLPGAYLSRDTESGNPGADYVRIALVAEPKVCEEGITRIAACIAAGT